MQKQNRLIIGVISSKLSVGLLSNYTYPALLYYKRAWKENRV